MTLIAITAFQLTTAAPETLERFYVEAIGFTAAGRSAIPARDMALLGLSGGGVRTTLRLGPQTLELDSFEQPGRCYPPAATAADLSFQHLAIVTSDAAAAWARARHLATPISADGPATLPASSGGVTAVKFRDPEGHPLEFLQLPPSADAPWRGEGNLGIDHSAISVADADVSRRFYERMGLAVRGAGVNRGPEQDRLDGLAGVQVEVVPMIPLGGTPHLELLAYRFPRGASDPQPPRPSDVAATRIVWAADCDALIHDADRHLHLLRRTPD